MRLKANIPDGEYVFAISWYRSPAPNARREIVYIQDGQVFAAFGPDITDEWTIEKIWSLVPYEAPS